MTRRIILTSLYGGKSGGKLHYYFSKDDDKIAYCDSLLSAEASCKYVLANHKIDEIVTFGSKSTYDHDDGLKSIPLREGSSFYASDIRDMSTYSLFRYRLAEYLDEINIEEQDIRELLGEDEQKKVLAFLNDYFYSKENSNKTTRFNRFFDHLMQDVDLRENTISALKEAVPEVKEDPERFLVWMFQHLYNEMKDSAKMELLESNNEVNIRFIPLGDDSSEDSFIQNFTNVMTELLGEKDSKVEIFICIQSDDASDTYVLMTLMNLVKAMPDSNVSIARVITTTRNPEEAVACISDDTDKFGITDLVAGTRAFLQYGKTDMLLDCWNRTGIHNTDIERLLYAMRNIDYGISLCDVSDIVRGIGSLRSVFKEVDDLGGNSFVEKYFAAIAQAIRQDYGPLVDKDEADFIDLVKWAYRKGFWQQTLTLVESRAPDDFVDKGFLYYSNSPSATEEVLKVFGQIYYDLKPYEKYKLEDVSHYYIKFYSRWRVTHLDDSKAYQMSYAKARIDELDTDDPELIKAHTICPDKEALQNLLFAYYYIGDVRNATNHAMTEFEGFSSIKHDSDVSERMNTIVQSINYFIHCYDKVSDLIEASGAKADVDKLDIEEIVRYSKKLRPRFHDNHERR